MKRISRYFIVSWLLLLAVSGRASSCVSTGSGQWTNTATWSCGQVPACGDSVTILAGHTVSITAEDYLSCNQSGTFILVIKGTLRFTAPGLLEISCYGRVQVYTGGQVVSAGGGGSSNAIKVCGSTWWNAAAGTYVGPGCMPATLPGCRGTLPIELSDFSATVCSEDVCLAWTTLSERHNSHFDVQRSQDALQFSTIGTVAAAGSGDSDTRLDYAFTDARPLDGIGYYRLLQVDNDGFSTEYPVIEINRNISRRTQFVAPNPSDGRFVIHSNRMSGVALLTVTDSMGETRWTGLCEFDARHDHRMDLSGLPPGIYQCIASNGSGTETFLAVIQR